MEPRSCDDYIHDANYPVCLRYYLLVNRLPALDGALIRVMKGAPKCFATRNGKRVRIVMASRFGDVGITPHLNHEHGYVERVYLSELSDFGEEP